MQAVTAIITLVVLQIVANKGNVIGEMIAAGDLIKESVRKGKRTVALTTGARIVESGDMVSTTVASDWQRKQIIVKAVR